MAQKSRYTSAGRKAASRRADAAVKLPVNSLSPAITGTQTQGQILSCSTGTWSNTPAYTRQWKRDGVAIAGATAATYTLVLADAGSVITCAVMAANSGVSGVAVSNTTGAIVAL